MVFATYEMQVDTLMVLRINYTDTLPLFQMINNNALPNVLSAVIFRQAVVPHASDTLREVLTQLVNFCLLARRELARRERACNLRMWYARLGRMHRYKYHSKQSCKQPVVKQSHFLARGLPVSQHASS